MCAISYYLERAGVMTTGISLVRENAEDLAPPRSLWVSFPLGRPLGVPSDPAFQHQVIAAGLDLLSRPSGPVLEDFPLDAPEVDIEDAPACPVSFPKTEADEGSWVALLTLEIAMLKTWYNLGKRRRGRTTVGVSRSDIEEIGRRFGDYLDSDSLPVSELTWFKRALEDAKAYYSEALTAQPGQYSHTATQNTFWHDTKMGAALKKFYEGFRQSSDLQLFARIIAPRDAIGASTGEEIKITSTIKPRDER